MEILSLYEVDDEMVFFMSDGAYFRLDGSVNKQNCRYYAAENPRNFHERSQPQSNSLVCSFIKNASSVLIFLRSKVKL